MSADKISTVLQSIKKTYFEDMDDYECWGNRSKRNLKISKIAENKYGLKGSELDDLMKLVDADDRTNPLCWCLFCDIYLSAVEEEDLHWGEETEGLICDNCAAEHFCEGCGDYYSDSIIPNDKDEYLCDCCLDNEN